MRCQVTRCFDYLYFCFLCSFVKFFLVRLMLLSETSCPIFWKALLSQDLRIRLRRFRTKCSLITRGILWVTRTPTTELQPKNDSRTTKFWPSPANVPASQETKDVLITLPVFYMTTWESTRQQLSNTRSSSRFAEPSVTCMVRRLPITALVSTS